jgi:Mn2+/Fe2+ NRAMP family transporter
MTVLTILLLIVGRYRLVQNISFLCVALFTLLTIANLLALQSYPAWAVGWQDLKEGLSGSLPPTDTTRLRAPIGTALATFGIIGVGASELIYYPYWCLEKGYARAIGPCDASQAWGDRARGWLRILRLDAWGSMVLYTFSTVAFYLLGAAVLFRQGLNPSDTLLVPTLAEMYRPVFGRHAEVVFLIGAVAVLYSTFFTASASQARILADTLRIFRLGARTEKARRQWTQLFCVLVPLASLTVYRFLPTPAKLILWSGVAQAIMLPMLGAAALFFRYRRCDTRTVPGRLWDVMLWISFAALLITGTFMALVKLFPEIAMR